MRHFRAPLACFLALLTIALTACTTSPGGPSGPAQSDPTYPGDPLPFDGVVISAVYGTGKKNTDAALSHGFVQLYNTTDTDLSLYGASLYHRKQCGDAAAEMAFPADAIIPAHGYYLVRTQGPRNYPTARSVLSMDAYDLTWNIVLDNKEISLCLAPSGWVIDPEAEFLTLEHTVSVFVASESTRPAAATVDDLSKNKLAVRTVLARDSGFHTVDLTRTPAALLPDYAPRTSDGRVSAVQAPRMAEVAFSHRAGVYAEDIALSLTAPAGYTVYYTTDGSDPTTSRTRKAYASPLSLTDSSALPLGKTTKAWDRASGGEGRPDSSTQPGGYVVKAYATNGKDSTDVFTNTYFIDKELASLRTLVVSLSAPVEDIMGENGFYSNYCPTGELSDPRPRGLAIMELFDETGAAIGKSRVELAVSGNGSSGAAMKSLRIYCKGANNKEADLQSSFNYDLFGGLATDADGHTVTSFSRLLLRNGGNDCGASYFRDTFMQRACAALRIDILAARPALVYINGEFWGVYNLRERYSPEYIQSHYGVNKDNVAILENDYSRVHTDTNVPYVVSAGLDGDAIDFNQLVKYMERASLADEDRYQYVCDRLDIDSFIDMYVARLFFNARDWPENNIKIWRNKNPHDPSGFDTKWHFTLLDLDMGMSFYPFTSASSSIFDLAFNKNSVCARVMTCLLENADFRERFLVRYYEVVTTFLTEQNTKPLLEEMTAERAPLMTWQAARWPQDGASVKTWEQNVKAMNRFLDQRTSRALRQLYDFFGVTESQIKKMMKKTV